MEPKWSPNGAHTEPKWSPDRAQTEHGQTEHGQTGHGQTEHGQTEHGMVRLSMAWPDRVHSQTGYIARQGTWPPGTYLPSPVHPLLSLPARSCRTAARQAGDVFATVNGTVCVETSVVDP